MARLLRPEPDWRPRRTYLHLSYSYATPFGPAILVTHDPQRSFGHLDRSFRVDDHCASGRGAVMDLEGWLRSLGLAHYEAMCRGDAIAAHVLHDLTEDHLREIGLPLGARLKLLKAISALAPGAEPIGVTPAVAPAGQPADAAERRQVTVMFSDLVGSTALAVRMDPEDLREI